MCFQEDFFSLTITVRSVKDSQTRENFCRNITYFYYLSNRVKRKKEILANNFSLKEEQLVGLYKFTKIRAQQE